MAEGLPRAYLDACVLLAYVCDEQNRAGTVQAILADADEDRIELVTSVVSITEVAYISDDPTVDSGQASYESIDQLWVPASPISLIDVSEVLTRAARAIIREGKDKGVRKIRSVDALHLASARLHDCDRFFTYENEATRQAWDSLIPASVTEPYSDQPRLDLP